MKVQEAIDKARLEAIKANYEHLKEREDWDTLSKTERNALMEVECGVSRQTFAPYLKQLNIEL